MEESGHLPEEEAARLIRQLHDRLKVLTAIQQAGQRLSQLRTSAGLAQEIVKVLDALSFEYAEVFLVEEDGQRLVPFAYRGQPEGLESPTEGLRVGKGITGWVASTGQSVRVGDVAQDPRYHEIHADTKSELCVPLRVGEKVIGVINVETRRLHAFSELDQAALEAFASHVSVAIQNARQFEQARVHTRELEQSVAMRTFKLEQQYRRQAALAEIELAINEPHELQQVLDRIAAVTSDLLPATGGVNVVLWERASEAYFIGASTVPGQPARKPAERIRREGGATRWIIDNRQSLVVPDVREDPFGANRMMTIYFNQAYVGTPLMVGNEVLGVLYAFDIEPREYSPEDLDFIYTLANRAAAAIYKVRLFESEREQRKLAETLRSANLALTQTLDLDTVLDTLLVFLAQLVPYDGANVMLLETGERFVIRALRGYDGMADTERLAGLGLEVGDFQTLSTIMATHKSLLVQDTERYQGWEQGLGTDFVRCWMGVPMVAGGRVIGLYSIDHHNPGAFSRDHLHAAEALAAQGAIAIQNAQLFRDVQRLAITDPLTGVHNRRHFLELAEREFSRTRRYGRSLSMIVLDLDHFKKVNDTYGHSAGDQVLRTITKRLAENIRDIDILGRYGGEEFVILLPETERAAALYVAERLRENVTATPIETDRANISLTISLGVATSTPTTESLTPLIDLADGAMYKAKQAGGNCVRAA